MWFWWFMLVMNLLVPLTMIAFGKRWYLDQAPERLKGSSGYRTPLSMKNQDTWEFAHKYCGRLWYITGWCLLPLSFLAMALLLGKDIATVGIVGGLVCLVQVLTLTVPIIPTEMALKNTFDHNGQRRKIKQAP